MIEAKHFWLHGLFFSNYIPYILRRDFNSLNISGIYEDRGLPLLLIGNHFSWWDGFFPYALNRRLFKRHLYLMMLEEQLARRRFFRRLGAFSINPGSRSVVESINYASEILKDKKNLLIVFPQGNIRSQYEHEMVFQKGWFRILKSAANPVHVLFMANLTDYFSNRKPSLHTYLEDYPQTVNFVFEELSSGFNAFYKRCIEQQKQLV